MGLIAYELVFALLAIAGITVAYAFVAQTGAPQPAGLIGHTLGIVGFLLMLSTETLYSIRKRVPNFNYGRTSVWLQVHIFTGLVGPYLVLLHTGGRFNGLAGILTLVTLIVVLSGLIGRYIYTAVPRSVDGAELTAAELEQQIARAERQLKKLGFDRSAMGEPNGGSDLSRHGWLLVLGRPVLRWRQKRQVRWEIQKLGAAGEAKAAQLEELLAQRQQLEMEIHSLAATRRLLALWHLFHVPLGGVLFTLAFIHIAAALYYATFLK